MVHYSMILQPGQCETSSVPPAGGGPHPSLPAANPPSPKGKALIRDPKAFPFGEGTGMRRARWVMKADGASGILAFPFGEGGAAERRDG